VKTAGVVLPRSAAHLVFGLAGELAVGIICGFVVNIVFVAAQMAGELLSRQIGTSLAQVINPLFESQFPIFGEFYYMFALVVFVAVNGHHVLLAGLVNTFERVPLMGAAFHAGMVEKAAGLMGDMFILMIRLAAPAFAALFLVTIALAIIARTVPQIHVLLIGFPLQVCLGLIVMSLALAGTAVVLGGSFSWAMREMDRILRFMIPR
jgi:flagellar biosynthetic protein FliR